MRNFVVLISQKNKWPMITLHRLKNVRKSLVCLSVCLSGWLLVCPSNADYEVFVLNISVSPVETLMGPKMLPTKSISHQHMFWLWHLTLYKFIELQVLSVRWVKSFQISVEIFTIMIHEHKWHDYESFSMSSTPMRILAVLRQPLIHDQQ